MIFLKLNYLNVYFEVVAAVITVLQVKLLRSGEMNMLLVLLEVFVTGRREIQVRERRALWYGRSWR